MQRRLVLFAERTEYDRQCLIESNYSAAKQHKRLRERDWLQNRLSMQITHELYAGARPGVADRKPEVDGKRALHLDLNGDKLTSTFRWKVFLIP